MRAATTVDLFSLSKVHFQEILEVYPEMKETISTVAVERLNMIGLLPPQTLSSVDAELEDLEPSSIDRLPSKSTQATTTAVLSQAKSKEQQQTLPQSSRRQSVLSTGKPFISHKIRSDSINSVAEIEELNEDQELLSSRGLSETTSNEFRPTRATSAKRTVLPKLGSKVKPLAPLDETLTLPD